MNNITKVKVIDNKIYYQLNGKTKTIPYTEYDFEVLLQTVINNFIKENKDNYSKEELDYLVKEIISDAYDNDPDKYIYLSESDYLDIVIERNRKKHKNIDPNKYINLSEEEYQKSIKTR